MKKWLPQGSVGMLPALVSAAMSWHRKAADAVRIIIAGPIATPPDWSFFCLLDAKVTEAITS
jgi:hypothetical protein